MAAKQQKIDELLDSIDRRQVEEYIRTTLERARRRKGLTVEQAAELFGRFQPRVRDVAGRGRWYGWSEKPDSVTATAFLAAAILAGVTELPGLPLDTVAGEETGSTDQEDKRQLAQHDADIQEMRANQEVLLTTVADLVQAVDEIRAALKPGPQS